MNKTLRFLPLLLLSLPSPVWATKLVTYSIFNEVRAGAIEGTYVVDLNRAYAFYLFNAVKAGPRADDSLVPSSLLPLLQGGEPALEAVRKTLEYTRTLLADPVEIDRLVTAGALRDLKRVKLLTPLPAPHRILAIGLNYRKHAEESGQKIPVAPEVFAKESLPIGAGETIRIPKAVTQPDYEAELAFVIGKPARNVPKERALDYVAGYTVGLDMTVRGSEDRSFRKSADSYAVLGPWLVTADEIVDPEKLTIWLELNGEPRQRSSTGATIVGLAELIEIASSIYTLYPGDVLLTAYESKN
jgi:2-keto-4-pentenoate hydratase/2-oxohepta-3-ene-1,7-dioic acid hydratase in catechol pathway